MSEKRAELLLACVIIARSTSFVFNKLGLGTMTAFNLLAVRFLLAFALLALVFYRKLRHVGRRTLLRGALLGGLFFLIMSGEMFSLRTVDSGTVSLLENMAILFVPLLESAISRRLPRPATLLSAAVALVGVALLTSAGGAFRIGVGRVHRPVYRVGVCLRHHHHGSALPPGRCPCSGDIAGGLSGLLRTDRRAAVRVAAAAADRLGVGHRADAGHRLHRVRLYAAAGGAEPHQRPAGEPVLRAQPHVCGDLRGAPAEGEDHGLERAGDAAHTGEHIAAAFFERRQTT